MFATACVVAIVALTWVLLDAQIEWRRRVTDTRGGTTTREGHLSFGRRRDLANQPLHGAADESEPEHGAPNARAWRAPV